MFSRQEVLIGMVCSHEASIKCMCMLDRAKSSHMVGILWGFTEEFSYGWTNSIIRHGKED